MEIVVLHRYWIYADRLRRAFLEALRTSQVKEIFESRDGLDEDSLAAFLVLSDFAIFMAYFYSALFVVVEGYRELKLHDSTVDELLESPNVDFLRLFRNGTMHFQPEPFSRKTFLFLDSEGSAAWVKALHVELGRFLLDAIKSRLPTKVREKAERMIEEARRPHASQ